MKAFSQVNYFNTYGDVLWDGLLKTTLDSNGDIYGLGIYTGTISIGNTLTSSQTAEPEWMICKYSNSGVPLWCSKIDDETGNNLKRGQVLDLKIVSNKLYFTISGHQNEDFIFIGCYQKTGVKVFTKKHINVSVAKACAYDSVGNVFVYGNFSTGLGYIESKVLIRKFNNTNGAIVFQNYFENTISNILLGRGISVYKDKFYIVGSFKNTVTISDIDGATSDIVVNALNIADVDMFIASFDLNGLLLSAKNISTTTKVRGDLSSIFIRGNDIFIYTGLADGINSAIDTALILKLDTNFNIINQNILQTSYHPEPSLLLLNTSYRLNFIDGSFNSDNSFYLHFSAFNFYNLTTTNVISLGNKLLRFDSDLNLIYDKDIINTTTTSNNFGISDIHLISDSCYIISGAFTGSLDVKGNTYNSNFSSMDGLLTSFCSNSTSTGFQNLSDNKGVFYPNPSNKYIQLQFDRNDLDFTYRLYDYTGKDVTSSTQKINSNTIDISSLSNGFYIINVNGLFETILKE